MLNRPTAESDDKSDNRCQEHIGCSYAYKIALFVMTDYIKQCKRINGKKQFTNLLQKLSQNLIMQNDYAELFKKTLYEERKR